MQCRSERVAPITGEHELLLVVLPYRVILGSSFIPSGFEHEITTSTTQQVVVKRVPTFPAMLVLGIGLNISNHSLFQLALVWLYSESAERL